MSPTLLRILREHEYWRQVWKYPTNHSALKMIHSPWPGATDKRTYCGRGKLKANTRPITYDTQRALQNGSMA
jgi:hypothetical protein